MDLKIFLPKKDADDVQEYFWSLIIEPGWVSAGIWRINKDSAQVVITSNPCAWELDKELITASDSALSAAIQGFPEELGEPSKTVFGVASSWVSGGEIREEYLDKIKILCSELSLTPIGFVVLPEAIAHLVKSEEGSPLNAVVIGLYRQTIEISVFKLGNLTGTTQVARSVSLGDDVVEGLTRFAGDSFPSRFILYDGKEGELEEARQELLSLNWEDYDKLKFLHTPKIELIGAQRKIHAVSLAGGSEIAQVTTVSVEKKDELVSRIDEQEGRSEEEEASLDKLGFALEKDVAQKQLTEAAREEEEAKEVKVEPPQSLEATFSSLRTKETVSSSPGLGVSKPTRGFRKVIDGMQLKLADVLSSFSFIKVGFGGGAQKTFLIGSLFLMIFILVGFLFWWFYPKATLTVYVAPKRLEEKIGISLDPSGEKVDFSRRILTAELKRTQVSGERTKETSGTKTVGEKARGEVTLYRVGPELTLAEGTILYGPEDLNFTLDAETTIASGSAGTPGTTKAAITAEDIGAQYNLAAGSTFSVGNYSTSDIEAKSENAFAGGSSREISAVSQEDQDILQKELENELLEKAKGLLSQAVTSEQVFIDESMTSSASSTTFSNKVGDEASTLKLSLTLDAEALVVSKSQLIEVSESAIKDKVPQGFVLRGEQMEFGFDFDRQEGEVYEFDLRISANLLPEAETAAIANSVRGRYPTAALEILEKEIPGFVRAEITIKPSLPGRLKTLPHVTQNIEVVLAAER